MAETLNAAVGIDFSLIGTKLHAMYEKNEKGYAVLLIPSEQTADQGITIAELISDIKKMMEKGTGQTVDTGALENAMQGAVQDSKTDIKPENIKIQLQMAYLYLKKSDTESILEYAFQLQVVTSGLIPEAIKGIVDVTNLSISVWNTTRKKVIDQMALVTVADYLGKSQALPVKEPA